MPGRCVNPELSPTATHASDVTDKDTARMMREDLFIVTMAGSDFLDMMGMG